MALCDLHHHSSTNKQREFVVIKSDNGVFRGPPTPKHMIQKFVNVFEICWELVMVY